MCCRKVRLALEKEGDLGLKKPNDIFFENKECIICRKTHIDDATQFIVFALLIERLLYTSHSPKTAGHQGDRRLFYSFRQKWSSMRLDCYAKARACLKCTRTRIKLGKHILKLKLFPASRQLQFVATHLSGKLPRTLRGNRFLLVIADRFSKHTRTVALRSTNAEEIEQAFVSQ